MQQQVPTNVSKLRRWSGDSPSPPRWSEDDTNFVRLTGQLVRPALRHLRQRRDASELTIRNAFAVSPGFSLLPDVRRPSDGPGVDLARRSPAWCKLGGDLLAARVLPASPRGGATDQPRSLATLIKSCVEIRSSWMKVNGIEMRAREPEATVILRIHVDIFGVWFISPSYH